MVVHSEDDVMTVCSNQSSEQLVPIFSVSSVTGEGLELLNQFLYLSSPGVSMKERELLEQVGRIFVKTCLALYFR